MSNYGQIYGGLMYYFAAAQHTSTVKLTTFFLTLQNEEHVLRINKSEIIGEKTFNGDLGEIEYNPEYV